MSNYQKISTNIQKVIIDNPKTPDKQLVWINITNAGKNELEYLRKKYNFKLTHLHASTAKTTAQRPKIEQNSDYLFMILHFPVFKNGNIVPGEIEFFIGPGFLVTIHTKNLKSLNEFFNFCKKDSDSLLAYKFESSGVLLYEILQKLIISCYNLLDKNSIAINNVENLIFAQKQKQAVSKILSLRLNIINIRKIMQNHKNIMKKLVERETRNIPPKKMKKYYNELIEHTKRIWENLENQKETIEVLNNTNESLLNYRISDIMKTLTIFSVIVFPLTLLAAVFGMNVTDGMPFIDMPNGFWVIISLMLMGTMGMIFIFAKKKWL
jgi:magnesium transporter